MSSRPLPTARGWCAAALGGAATVAGGWLGYPDLTAIGIVLVVAVAASWLALLRAPGLTGTRRLSSRVVVRGGTCTASLALRSPRAAVALRVQDRFERTGVPVEITGTPAGDGGWSGAGSWPVPTGRRGSLAIGPVRAHRGGFCGLAAIEDQVVGTETLTVLPKVLPTRAIPSAAVLNKVGTHRLAELGGTDLISLRAYQPGDDLRRLSWAASARVGSLMLREDGEPGSAELTVLLDDAETSASPAEFEEMVDVAASLAAAAISANSPVTVVSTSRRLTAGTAAASAHAPAGRDEVTVLLALAGQHAGPPSGTQTSFGGDIVVVVAGAGSPLPDLLGLARGAAWRGAIVVDEGAERRVTQRGQTIVVEGPDAAGVLTAWAGLR